VSRLPVVGDLIQVYGICCEGCGRFHGQFRVRAVVERPEVSILLVPHVIQSEGAIKHGTFSPTRVRWRRDLECWLTDCGHHDVVVHIPDEYYGPSLKAA
jgi:hypothetical protein